MHKPLTRRVSLAALCLLPLVAAAQEGLKLKPQPALILVPPSSRDAVPVFLEADTVRGHNDKDTEAEGNVRLRKRGQAVFGDWLRYDKREDEVTAVGNVRIEQGGDIVEGERLRYNLETDRGFMEKPRYTMTRPPAAIAPAVPAPGPSKPRFTGADARGRAERLLFEGARQYRAQQAEYTTCEPGNDSWYIRSAELHIDKDRDVGIARDASIVFMGRTILYSPYLSFTLHQQRKSGFLTPHYGTTSKSGTEFTLPYYWNIAPNRDATLYPRFMTKRGLQLNTDFRYLEPTLQGEARAEFLPSDQQLNQDRYALFYKHTQSFANGWSGALNLNKVSDDKYFTDLSNQIALTSQTILPREATLSRSGDWGRSGVYGFTAQVQRWQTLQADPLAPTIPPYSRQPQLTLTAQNQDIFHSDFDFIGSFVDFGHPTLVNGQRLMAYPSLSLPLQTSYAYLTPKIGMHMTHYAVGKNNISALPDSTRTLPIFTTETGLVFERDTTITGQRFIQTLEPKLYYVYIPFRDQSRIPNFESGVQDINLATIFAENQFSGHDRINDANQVTLGVISRFINPDSGIERLRVALAQRYYFQSQRVTVPLGLGGAGTVVPPRPSQSSNSDLLAALSGPVAPNWVAEAGWQFNTDHSQTQKFNAGVRYQPQPGKVLNLVYRDTIDSIRQTDVSTQWPLTSQWTLLARWNYSLFDKRTLEALGGIEYNGGCWVVRVVGHRFATAIQQASTSIFVQLELNGVSRIGSNPMDTLQRNIAGYVKQDPRPPGAEDHRIPGF